MPRNQRLSLASSITTMPLSPAERARRYRQRQGVPFEPQTCPVCGGTVGSKRSAVSDALCRPCWERLTPEGRAAKADRVRRSRQRMAQRTATRS